MPLSQTERNKRYVARLKVRLKEARGYRCEHCSATEELEWAHKVPTKLNGMGRGQARRLFDIKKNPDKYLLLCKTCHRKFDQQAKQQNGTSHGEAAR